MRTLAAATPTIVYRIQSDSDPDVAYNVAVARGVAVCDCQGFRSHRNCKHARKVLEMTTDQETAERALVPIKVTPPAATLPAKSELSIMKAVSYGLLGKDASAAGIAFPEQLNTPAKVFAVVLAGWELGLKPMTALRHCFVVNGKTDLDGQAMISIVMAREPDSSFIPTTRTAEKVVMRFRRPSRGVDVELEYTIDDATRAGLINPRAVNWQRYPKDMLTWAAAKRLCRIYAGDLINAVSLPAAAAMLEAAPDDDQAPSEAFDADFRELYNEGDEPAPTDENARSADTNEAPDRATPEPEPEPHDARLEAVARLKALDEVTRAAWIKRVNDQFKMTVFNAAGDTMLSTAKRLGPMDWNGIEAWFEAWAEERQPDPPAAGD